MTRIDWRRPDVLVLDDVFKRSRFYRYGMGADFREHEDEAWRPKRNVRSFLTVLVYLPTDEPCVGGETVIDGEVVAVAPRRVVVFPPAQLASVADSAGYRDVDLFKLLIAEFKGMSLGDADAIVHRDDTTRSTRYSTRLLNDEVGVRELSAADARLRVEAEYGSPARPRVTGSGSTGSPAIPP